MWWLSHDQYNIIVPTDTCIPQDPGSPPAHRKNAQIQNLEKQLEIEQRVKSGAETMITMYTNAKNKHEKKLLNEAQQMLSDSKTKVEVLKMKIMRLNVMSSVHNKDEERENEQSQKFSKSAPAQSPEGRVAMLRYRIDVETRLMQGAKSIIKANPKAKSSHVQSVGLCLGSNVHLSQGQKSSRLGTLMTLPFAIFIG